MVLARVLVDGNTALDGVLDRVPRVFVRVFYVHTLTTFHEEKCDVSHN